MARFDDRSRAEKAAAARERHANQNGIADLNRKAALDLAAAGIFIFPALVSWDAATKKFSKRPAISGWQESATTDPKQIETWWLAFPSALAAIEIGRSGLVAVDLDRHPGEPDGVAAFKRLTEGQPRDSAPMTKTASGGFHIIFRQPEGGEPFGNGRGALPPGIDIRGAGGWIVAPGAVAPEGRWQSVANSPALADAFRNGTIPHLPEWLAEIIRPPREDNKSSDHSAGTRECKYAAAALGGRQARCHRQRRSQ
jgi:hypothetical protein